MAPTCPFRVNLPCAGARMRHAPREPLFCPNPNARDRLPSLAIVHCFRTVWARTADALEVLVHGVGRTGSPDHHCPNVERPVARREWEAHRADSDPDSHFDGGEEYEPVRAGSHPHLQKGSRTRGLEARERRALRPYQDVSDLPLVRPARTEADAGRPASAGGLLSDRSSADESEFALLSVVRYRLPQRLR